MKKGSLVLLMALLFVQLVACERNTLESESPVPSNARTAEEESGSAPSRIETAKTAGIKRKEPTQFTLVNAKSPFVKWRVIPKQVVENQGTKSMVYFQEAGKYRVLAIDSIGTDTAFIDVEISHEIYQRPDYAQKIQQDDELLVTPRALADSARYLDLQLTTRKAYNCTENNLWLKSTKTGSQYECAVEGVDVSLECTPGQVPSKGIFVVGTHISDGTTGNLVISFNGKTYKGTFTRTGRGYTFNWPYESGVIFTTKSI
ncbi:hypothetical protein [Dyadobacter sandarakinus]|uniref:Lipoprotein n=1 Tax=Dyadobacter sandarakinus TaxID=2747268 RepID=A0ABX7I1C2_9BACT|nr:hypothetical protein [Dyadobacter sandarakinus]QRQ99828.1 hypothetical protein HWI92_02295 [Dyadobacter sandarakinus]